MTAPNWKRRMKKLYRYAADLRADGVVVVFPDDFETPPPYRGKRTSAIVGVSRMGPDDSQISGPIRPNLQE